ISIACAIESVIVIGSRENFAPELLPAQWSNRQLICRSRSIGRASPQTEYHNGTHSSPIAPGRHNEGSSYFLVSDIDHYRPVVRGTILGSAGDGCSRFAERHHDH